MNLGAPQTACSWSKVFPMFQVGTPSFLSPQHEADRRCGAGARTIRAPYPERPSGRGAASMGA